jgi:hypothetical protein
MNERSLLYIEAKNHLGNQLARNPLFYTCETTIGSLLVLLDEKKLIFESHIAGEFCTDALFKLADEASGFLSCLQQGSFYSSLHHIRALVELYAITHYCLQNNQTRIFNRYQAYNKVRRHILFLDSQNGTNPWHLTPADLEFLKKNYETLDIALVHEAGFKDLEQARSKIKRSSNWLINLEELLKHAGEFHFTTYEQLCYYTHFSPLSNRSKQAAFGFPLWWEQTLHLTAYYIAQIVTLLAQAPYSTPSTKQLLQDMHKNLGFENPPQFI